MTTPTQVSATTSPAVEKPQATRQRLDKEMNDLARPAVEAPGVTRETDPQCNRVDTWQTGKAGQSHTTETYTRNPNGTLSKSYRKDYPDGTHEHSTLEVGECGSRKTTTYTRDGHSTTVTIQTLPDGSRVVEKRNSDGKSVTTRYTPDGKRVPDEAPQQGPTGASPTPPASAPTPDKTAPKTDQKTDIPPPTQPPAEQLEKDRVAFYDFFQAHPTHGDQKDYEKSMRELAAQGNTYARQKLGEHTAKEIRFNTAEARDAETLAEIDKNCAAGTAAWATASIATLIPAALAAAGATAAAGAVEAEIVEAEIVGAEATTTSLEALPGRPLLALPAAT